MLLVFVLCTSAAVCSGQERVTALPDFDLVTADGNTISTSQFTQTGQWLLVYVELKCRSCDAWLGFVNTKDHPEIAANSVIIVGGASADDVKNISTRVQGWTTASWYADPQKNAFQQLKITGMPVAFGMTDRNVSWSVKGTLGHSKDLDSILGTWVRP